MLRAISHLAMNLRARSLTAFIPLSNFKNIQRFSNICRNANFPKINILYRLKLSRTNALPK